MKDQGQYRCNLNFIFPSEEAASTIASAMEIDNEGYVLQKVEGNKLSAEISSDTIGGLKATLEDYLACIKVAEEVEIRRD